MGTASVGDPSYDLHGFGDRPSAVRPHVASLLGSSTVGHNFLNGWTFLLIPLFMGLSGDKLANVGVGNTSAVHITSLKEGHNMFANCAGSPALSSLTKSFSSSGLAKAGQILDMYVPLHEWVHPQHGRSIFCSLMIGHQDDLVAFVHPGCLVVREEDVVQGTRTSTSGQRQPTQ